jgi:hypothetical protein
MGAMYNRNEPSETYLGNRGTGASGTPIELFLDGIRDIPSKSQVAILLFIAPRPDLQSLVS